MARSSPIWQAWLRYAAAVPVVAAAAAVRAAFLGALETRLVWITFYPAVMISALYGGLPAGLLATVLSCLTARFLWPLFVDKPFISDQADWLGMAVFFINCAVISGVAEARMRAQTRAKQAMEEAEAASIQLAEASKAKSDFLANMSHELRTPLNSIIGFSEVLKDRLCGELNEKQDEYLSDILSSSWHLLDLINDILDLSKMESGKTVLDLNGFSVRDILNGSMAMVKEKAMKHGIKLDLELAPAVDIEIEADDRKLKQVLFNLLSNAVKFTPDGGSVQVRARKIAGADVGAIRRVAQEDGRGSASPLLQDTDFIEISVKDTGIGIKPGDLPRLFNNFTQLESAYSKTYEGTGLGLALSKKLVELHGGRIWVESELGTGSKFTFLIPVRQIRKVGSEL